jgi:hypothetical protein
VRLLLTTDKNLLSGADMSGVTGIRPNDLAREFQSERVAAIARGRGWRISTRSLAGLPGKGRVLVCA